MEFSNLRIKELESVLKHTPSVKSWYAKGRTTHIVGIQLRGEMFHEFKERTITLSEGDVFFFNARDDFRALVRELGASYTVHFTTFEPIETESFVTHAQNPREFVSLLEGIERAAMPASGKTNGNLARSLFYKLCYLLDEQAALRYRPFDSRISRAEEHLRLHFKEKAALSHAVAVSALTARRFGDLFKGQYGTTPGKYLTALRIAAAKEMLTASNLSVKQIAEACGIPDLYYFSKLFKKETGLAPTDFKRNNV